MKKIVTLAVGLIGAALVVGCGDDSSDGPATISCLYKQADVNTFCATGPGTEADCTGAAGTVVASCPAGSTSSCTVTSDGTTGTVYFYDETVAAALSPAMCD